MRGSIFLSGLLMGAAVWGCRAADETSGGSENSDALCADQQDNDGDGAIDCGDTDCAPARACKLGAGDGGVGGNGGGNGNGNGEGGTHGGNGHVPAGTPDPAKFEATDT